MPCTGLSQGPTPSSTPEFCQMQDQWLQILWSETGKESDRAIRFPLRITLGWSCLGGPLSSSLKVSQSLLTGMSHGNGPRSAPAERFISKNSRPAS